MPVCVSNQKIKQHHLYPYFFRYKRGNRMKNVLDTVVLPTSLILHRVHIVVGKFAWHEVNAFHQGFALLDRFWDIWIVQSLQCQKSTRLSHFGRCPQRHHRIPSRNRSLLLQTFYHHHSNCFKLSTSVSSSRDLCATPESASFWYIFGNFCSNSYKNIVNCTTIMLISQIIILINIMLINIIRIQGIPHRKIFGFLMKKP
mgnify:CR=1 FL=1